MGETTEARSNSGIDYGAWEALRREYALRSEQVNLCKALEDRALWAKKDAGGETWAEAQRRTQAARARLADVVARMIAFATEGA